ncbi:hypothetical protein [Macrococcus armenti]|uniref:hypothetical protein n=1 Tax=Macrococcus armenti TaxID=2875764 RepID=UPI001CD764CF|nr:hypothetical protein [Macrococcus armenti]UBH10085.1 hypothetical protein LAU38_07300 [Macrococcus armenti]
MMSKKHTVKNVLKDTLKQHKDIQDVVVVVSCKNKVITEAYSHMDKTEVLGILECAKHNVLLDMTEEE